MARYRLSANAKADLTSILETSAELHGNDAYVRYRALLSAALRRVAAEPYGVLTADRPEIGTGIRSFHIRRSRGQSRETPVAKPVHVIFYRVAQPGIIEIIRILHERMEPGRHIGTPPEA